MLCAAHPVQHVRPALHGYTLEHRQHGKGKVVEVGDAVVWALPSHFAHRPVAQAMSAIRSVGRAWGRLFFRNGGCDRRNTVTLALSTERVSLKCIVRITVVFVFRHRPLRDDKSDSNGAAAERAVEGFEAKIFLESFNRNRKYTMRVSPTSSVENAV